MAVEAMSEDPNEVVTRRILRDELAITRNDVRDELAKFEEKLEQKLEQKMDAGFTQVREVIRQDVEAGFTQVREVIRQDVEARFTQFRELIRQDTQSAIGTLLGDLQRNLALALEPTYATGNKLQELEAANLPARVTRLENKVFPPKRTPRRRKSA